MKNHFRTAVLTVILAGGTLVSYATAYTVMDWKADTAIAATSASVRPAADAVRQRAPGRTDVSVREACATFENAASRARCTRDIAGVPHPVRVIDLAGAGTTDSRS